MTSLYNILAEFKFLEEELIESGGELTPELEERLAINENDLKEKLEGYAKVVSNHQALIEGCKHEAQRLDALAERSTNLIKTLKERMLQAVKTYGTPNKKGVVSVETALFRFSTHKSGSVNVFAVDLLPEEYVRIVPEQREADKKKIQQAIARGSVVPGAVIEHKISLVIK